jgi:hypothetical protein
MMENKKHVFWQAFFLTVLFFSIGLVLGIYLEQARADNLNIVFSNSEVNLYDSSALRSLLEDSNISCGKINDVAVLLADKIYEEAKELEKYDESNKLTESIKAVHRKYDALRTLLWIDVISLKERCPEINTVVYLYEYSTDEISVKSEQVVWSRILGDLKTEKRNEVILIPIAADQNLLSLEFIMEKYGIEKTPAVIINEETALYEHKTVEEISDFLKN